MYSGIALSLLYFLFVSKHQFCKAKMQTCPNQHTKIYAMSELVATATATAWSPLATANAIAVAVNCDPDLGHVRMNHFGRGYGWKVKQSHSSMLSLQPMAMAAAKVA